DISIERLEQALFDGRMDRVGIISGELIKHPETERRVWDIRALWLAAAKRPEEAAMVLSRAAGDRSSCYPMAMALVELHRGHDDAALEQARAAAEGAPRHPYPWNIIGRVHLDRQEYPAARDAFSRAIELNPLFAPAHSNLGVTVYFMGDAAGAVAHLRQALEIFPGYDEAYYGLSLCYEELGQHDRAIGELQRGLEINPENRHIAGRLGRLLVRRGRCREALDLVARMEAKQFDDAALIAGRAHLGLGDAETAVRLLAAAPRTYETRYSLALALLAAADFRQARTVFAELEGLPAATEGVPLALFALDGLQETGSAAPVQPAAIRVTVRLYEFMAGNLLAAAGRRDAAMEQWCAATGFMPGYRCDGLEATAVPEGPTADFARLNLAAVLYFNEFPRPALDLLQRVNNPPFACLWNYVAAQCCLRLNDFDAAAVRLRDAVAENQNFYSALALLGELSYRHNDLAATRDYLRRALAVRQDFEVLLKYGLASESAGDPAAAEKTYTRMVELFPDVFVGYNQLAWLYARQRTNLPEALQLAAKADRLQPGNASCLDTLGWLQHLAGDHEKALETLEQAVGVSPRREEILYHLGTVHRQLGNAEKAREYFSRALEAAPEGEYTAEMKRFTQQHESGK
ncbi:MAG: tetratricopeptide repeat protein, partial [Deltaproteobacteria bacterium]|nr:tetratricopeptide repeat protein [Candidatus Anaeroferrophillacea bacterium]